MSGRTYIFLKRGIISVTGKDAYKFLQNIVTNDLGRVIDGNAIYSFILTPQGKYLFDFFISGGQDSYLIEVADPQKDDLLKKLKIYKLRSDVEIMDISSDYSLFLLSESLKDVICYKDPRSEKLPFRAIIQTSLAKKILQENGFNQAPSDIYHMLRIDNNIPEGEYDLEKDKSFPIHFRMREINGVDFRKGCYVGQEVTARMHHRDAVRKSVYRVEVPEDSSIDLEKLKGAEIEINGSSIGKILSTHHNRALALINTDMAQSNSQNLQILGFNINILQ